MCIRDRVGNVEIHDKASDWYLHAHDKDERYDNVILHVCGTIDTEARNSKGTLLVQMQLDIPDHVLKHYQELLTIDQYPPCYQIIPSLSKLTVHSWMSALQTERLSQKTAYEIRLSLVGSEMCIRDRSRCRIFRPCRGHEDTSRSPCRESPRCPPIGFR